MTKTYNAKLVPMGKSGYDKSDIVTNELGVNKDLIAQRLKITDDKGMLIASYPQIPNISYKIDLADVRKWIESGCKESVELEVELSDTYTRDGLQPRLSLTNNTVKMVWGEQDKAQPIAGDNGKPIVVERFACNGEHSHWEVIEPIDGAILWSGEDHHPATDWEALRRKFHGWFIDRTKKQPYDTESIFNFFKNELTK